MMALVVGVNAYISIADANTYFSDSLLGPTWESLIDDVKSRSIVTSSKHLSFHVIESQKLPIAPEDINSNLAIASAEYALALSQDNSLLSNVNTGSNTKRLKAGEAEIEYFSPTISSSTRFPQLVTDILEDLLESQYTIVTPEVSGTDEQTCFSQKDSYELNSGL